MEFAPDAVVVIGRTALISKSINISLTEGRMKFISRKDLGWPPSAAPMKTRPTKGVKIHYEGTYSPVRDHSYCKGYWTGIRNSHLANKQEGYSDVAYSFAVCRHGYVLEGRGFGRRTGANGNQTLNADHDAVCVLYGTNDKSVDKEVVTAVREVIQDLRDHGTGKEIKGHRDGYATACPGEPLYALVKSGAFEPNQKEEEDDLPTPKDVWSYKNERQGETSDAYAYLRKTGKDASESLKRIEALEKKIDAILAKLK
jgi:hypothetical protein